VGWNDGESASWKPPRREEEGLQGQSQSIPEVMMGLTAAGPQSNLIRGGNLSSS